MRDLILQIEYGLSMKMYYLSLFGALAIPDICAAIDSDNGETSGGKYKKWFDIYVAPKYNGFLSGSDCWHFRCAMLHQFRSQHIKNRYARKLFIEPHDSSIVSHNNILNDALNIDVRIFCADIIAGAKKWLSNVENTELYRVNCKKCVQRYPSGLSPYIIGVPVIS